jgi:hypothetical protein
MSDRYRFDLIDQEMLASQVVAVMDAHWCRPNAAQKRDILRRAERQIEAGFRVLAPPTSGAVSPVPEAPRACSMQERGC